MSECDKRAHFSIAPEVGIVVLVSFVDHRASVAFAPMVELLLKRRLEKAKES